MIIFEEIKKLVHTTKNSFKSKMHIYAKFYIKTNKYSSPKQEIFYHHFNTIEILIKNSRENTHHHLSNPKFRSFTKTIQILVCTNHPNL